MKKEEPDWRATPLFSLTAVRSEEDLRSKGRTALAVQQFYILIRNMDRAKVEHAYAEEIVALREAIAAAGVLILKPLWFKQLLR